MFSESVALIPALGRAVPHVNGVYALTRGSVCVGELWACFRAGREPPSSVPAHGFHTPLCVWWALGVSGVSTTTLSN